MPPFIPRDPIEADEGVPEKEIQVRRSENRSKHPILKAVADQRDGFA